MVLFTKMMKIGKKQFYLVLEIRSSVLKKASLTYLLGVCMEI